jgi:hypothetical protein
MYAWTFAWCVALSLATATSSLAVSNGCDSHAPTAHSQRRGQGAHKAGRSCSRRRTGNFAVAPWPCRSRHSRLSCHSATTSACESSTHVDSHPKGVR